VCSSDLQRIAADLRVGRIEEHVIDVATLRSPFDLSPYAIAFVAASVHRGHHEPEMVAFVRGHRDALRRVRGVFVSVSLSEAGAEDRRASAAARRQSAADAQHMIDTFVSETGWSPERSLPVAGALAYSRYNVFIRFVMKRIARKHGAPTDTSRDYEFTDWPALDRFVDAMVQASAGRRDQQGKSLPISDL